MAGKVAAIGPRTVASQIAQYVEVSTRNGTNDLQLPVLVVVDPDAVDVVASPSSIMIRGDVQSECLTQFVRLGDGNNEDVVVAVAMFVHIDVAGILCPSLAVEFAKPLRHINLEVVRQRYKGISLQLRHAVAADVDGFKALATNKCRGTNELETVRQRDGRHVAVAGKGALQALHKTELPEIVERLDIVIVVEDAFNVLGLQVLRREEMSLIGQCPCYGIVLERSYDTFCLTDQFVVAHVVTYLLLCGDNHLDGCFPRIVIPTCIIMGEVVGKQRQFVDAT